MIVNVIGKIEYSITGIDFIYLERNPIKDARHLISELLILTGLSYSDNHASIAYQKNEFKGRFLIANYYYGAEDKFFR